MSKITLKNGDCLDELKKLENNSIDSVVTDPPYGLSFMGKKWDYDVPSVEMWKECLRVLKPGGYLLAFAGTRTQHRMAVNIEDAGFEIRDMIAWIYGSGFPKSHNIGKAVDKLQGNERELLRTEKTQPKFKYSGSGKLQEKWLDKDTKDITKGTSEWEGWGTALKPAHEPITVARKPFKGTVAQNVLEHGTGGINIDGCRVETTEETRIAKGGWPDNGYVGGEYDNEKYDAFKARENNGRFPANLIHDGSEEVVELFPDSNGSGKARKLSRSAKPNQEGWGMNKNSPDEVELVDAGSGSASRFFKSFPIEKGEAQLIAGLPKTSTTTREVRSSCGCISNNTPSRIIYQAKASKKDRNEGLDGFEDKLTKGSIGLNTVGGSPTNYKECRINKNHHPTVKPTKLMQYLVRLVTRKGGVVLDPFMGSGSTGKACKLEGMDFIGIELDPEYVKIAEARINNI